MTRKPDSKTPHDPVDPIDPGAFGDFLRKLEHRIEEHWADNPSQEPVSPPDPMDKHKPGTLIAAEKDVWRWELVEKLELGLCGGPERCKQARCRRARRCTRIERLWPQMQQSRDTLAREQSQWQPPPAPELPPPPRRRRAKG